LTIEPIASFASVLLWAFCPFQRASRNSEQHQQNAHPTRATIRTNAPVAQLSRRIAPEQKNDRLFIAEGFQPFAPPSEDGATGCNRINPIRSGDFQTKEISMSVTKLCNEADRLLLHVDGLDRAIMTLEHAIDSLPRNHAKRASLRKILASLNSEERRVSKRIEKLDDKIETACRPRLDA
jgi:predicted RNase H-like nuclease (RuvC/YqgF family)